MLILSLISTKDMYGIEIAQELAQHSGGNITLNAGTIYPILYRLTEKGFLSTRAELVGTRRTRIYYHLEPKGREYLRQLREKYDVMQKGILTLFNYVDQAK